MVFESGPLCVEKRAAHLDSSMQFLQWWLGTSAQTTWANSRGDVSANPKVRIPDPAVNTLNADAGSGHYQLVNRYFEAAPPPVLSAALDAVGGFTVDTSPYPPALSPIQKAARDYWAPPQSGAGGLGHRAGRGRARPAAAVPPPPPRPGPAP